MSKGKVVDLLSKPRPLDVDWPEPDMELAADDRTEAPSLPDEVLPLWMDWARQTAEAAGCPVDYVAVTLLAAASTWLGNVRRISPSPDWIEPPHLWMALVGPPSAGKTPAQRPMTEVSKLLEREADPRWQDEVGRYDRDVAAAKAASEKWEKEVKDAVGAGKAGPDRPKDAAPPDAPGRPRVVTGDATTEALILVLRDNPRGVLQVRDELAGWLGSFDRYSNGAGADRAFFLETWNGGRYTSDRVKFAGKPMDIEYCSLSIWGGVVPDKLPVAIEDSGDDGLAARFCWIWPNPAPYRPLPRGKEAAAAAEQRRKSLLDCAHRLQGLSFKRDKEQLGTLPIVLPLDEDALSEFEDLRRDAKTRAESGRGLTASWAGKNEGRALRLALVIEHLTWAAKPSGIEPKVVTRQSMSAAKAFLDYAERMLHQVISGLSIGEAEQDAAQIARFLLQRRTRTLKERELYRSRGAAHLRKGPRLAAALAVLEVGNWICKSDLGLPRSGAGGRPPKTWEVNPKIFQRRPRRPSKPSIPGAFVTATEPTST